MFESINLSIVELFGPLGGVMIAGVLGIVLIGITYALIPSKRSDPLQKFKDEQRGIAAAREDRPNARRKTKASLIKLDRYAAFLEPSTEKEMTDARKKMVQAGYHSPSAVRSFHALQFVLGIGLLLTSLLTSFIFDLNEGRSALMQAVTTLSPALIGYYLPKYWVEKRRTERQDEIVAGFPDALDMLLICVEAGQSLDQSIMRVGHELKAGFPALSEELATVSQEVKAGKDRTQVLRDMADRCGISDISSFVTVLVQSAQFGTSISDALRVFASEMRDKRVMMAEEKANVLPTKLTLGTMMFTVPPLLIILIGPSVYGISTMMASANFGG
jgi:tight adherence protein C